MLNVNVILMWFWLDLIPDYHWTWMEFHGIPPGTLMGTMGLYIMGIIGFKKYEGFTWIHIPKQIHLLKTSKDLLDVFCISEGFDEWSFSSLVLCLGPFTTNSRPNRRTFESVRSCFRSQLRTKTDRSAKGAEARRGRWTWQQRHLRNRWRFQSQNWC